MEFMKQPPEKGVARLGISRLLPLDFYFIA